MKGIVLELEGLDCASCASEIEAQTGKLPFVNSANLNFVTKKLDIDLEEDNKEDEVIKEVNSIVTRLEPDVVVKNVTEDTKIKSGLATIKLEGLDCAGCAEKIEDLVNKMEEVESANLNFVNKKMDINLKDLDKKSFVIDEITRLVNKLEPGVEVVDISEVKTSSKSEINLGLKGLDCASCGDSIEQYTKKLDGVTRANLDFVNQKMSIEIDGTVSRNDIIKDISEEMFRLDPKVIVEDKSRKSIRALESNKVELELKGLDCGSCADSIVQFTEKLEGVNNVTWDFMNTKLGFELEDIRTRNKIIDDITKKMNIIEPHVEVRDLSNLDIEDEEAEVTVKKSMKKENKELIKIIAGSIFFVLPFLLKLEGNLRFTSYFISYLIVGYDVIITAFRNLFAGNPMDEHFLMTIATIAAFITGEYPEGVMVMLLYKVGEYLQGLAVNHSRRSIASAMDIRPDYANLVLNGDVIVVDPEDVQIGDEILIRPGERVPLDGVVVEGESTLDTSNITGESVPRSIKEGEDIVSGVVNNNGLLKVRVNKEFGESTITKILDLVENASSRKAPTENFITKFSRVYTPIVVVLAIMVAIIPALFMKTPWMDSLYNAAVFLVISCPCALVISVPLGFFGGIGAASKEGILVKGSNYLEALNEVDTLVFDKTGTITKGTFKVTNIETYSNYTKDEILEIGAYGEAFSNHPIGRSIIDSYGKEIDTDLLSEYEEIPGRGISVKIKDKNILLGNDTLLKENNINFNKQESIGTIVYIAEDNTHIGTIVVSDEIKPNIKETLEELKSLGVNESIMLSGDNQETVDKVAEVTGISKAYGDLLPQDKVELFEEIIDEKHKENKKSKVAFVGDGVNDAPVLARADIGIAMGGLGSDAAIEASDIVIMTDEIHKITTGKKIAGKTKRIVTQNIVLALGVKLVVLVLGAFGQASMWQAVFADVGVSIIAIFNSIRALKVDK